MPDYTALLDHLAEHGNLSKACRELSMARSAFLDAVSKDSALADKYARAREAGLDAEGDRAIQEALEAKDAALGRLALDARKWYLSKLLPKKYGDKLAVGGAGDLPAIQTQALDTSSLDDDTLRRVAALPAK